MRHQTSIFDLTTPTAAKLSAELVRHFEAHDLKAALAACALAAGFCIDHMPSDDGKQRVYEEFLKAMADIMSVAPGVNR